jgi:CheY-like chemotaxis protein
MKQVLILEDSPERISAFTEAIRRADAQLLVWKNAHDMIRDLPRHPPNATLLSLDFDLIPERNSTQDPGNGLVVSEYLKKLMPVCPIILYSSNEKAVWEMVFKLGEGNWESDWLRHDPLGVVWIGTLWLPKVWSYLARMAT